MKKIIMFLSFVLFCISANASSDYFGEIKIEKIALEANEFVGNNETLEIKYELIPNDLEDKKITWEVLENKNVEIILENKETKTAKGILSLSVKNLTDKTQEITVVAKSNNLKQKLKINIEDENTTTKREKEDLKKEIEEIILKFPEEIDSENYNSVQRDVEKVEKSFFENEDIINEIDSKTKEKYESFLNLYNSYKEKTIAFENIVIISLLSIAFLIGLYVIFKKEKK